MRHQKDNSMPKTAREILDDLLHYCTPPHGVEIVIVECGYDPAMMGAKNWHAGMFFVSTECNAKFAARIDELEKSDPLVIWPDPIERNEAGRLTSRWIRGSLRDRLT